MTEEEEIRGDPLKLAKILQKLRQKDDDDEVKEQDPGRRKTVGRLIEAGQKSRPSVIYLDVAFKDNAKNPGKYEGQIRRKTLAAINDKIKKVEQRRMTIVENQKSMAMPRSQAGGPQMHFGFDS